MNSEQNTMRTRRLAFLIPLAGFLVLTGFASIALLATLRGERDMTQLPSAMVGKPAPAVALPDLRDAGSTVSTIDFKGRPFLVNVFASWCAPCRAESPTLALLSAVPPSWFCFLSHTTPSRASVLLSLLSSKQALCF